METRTEESQSSASGSESEISDPEEYRTPKNVKRVAKKRVEKEKKRERKKERNRVEEKISKEDFYNKSLEFKTWLLEEKKKFFEGLSSEKAKELFKKFVKKWNSKKLPKKYYRGINLYLTTAPERPDSRWSFAESTFSEESFLPSPADSAVSADVDRSLPTTPFSTFGKETPCSTISTRKFLKPIFVPSPVVPDSQRTLAVKHSDCGPKGTPPLNEMVNKNCVAKQELKDLKADDKAEVSRECITSPSGARKRRYDEMNSDTVQRVTQAIHAHQEVERKKMKVLLEMSRSTKVSRNSWKENDEPAENSGCGYFQV